MRPVLLIEAAAIGIVTAYGFLSLWHDWKMSHGPQTVVLQFHISPKNPPKGWRISASYGSSMSTSGSYVCREAGAGLHKPESAAKGAKAAGR